MLGCQELNIYENPREEEFLGVFLGGGVTQAVTCVLRSLLRLQHTFLLL
ncbi:putative transposable element encoded protein [Trachipleistophora hominis]|uniref:Putative transposable element encoded protein n=1 Tax=Trachipleistophora hominis TaxID=72359 RepID=L7JT99_TRAHO|nr:putative transposable element encoded protein [Trachipleistophora hominis]